MFGSHKLVGWNIDIRSEEEIKREVTEQMGALIASGEAVPLSVIEGVTPLQAETLATHDINDIDALAPQCRRSRGVSGSESRRSEVILEAAKAVVAMRDRTLHPEAETGDEQVEAQQETRLTPYQPNLMNRSKPARLNLTTK
jgi:N utilization substance protein A